VTGIVPALEPLPPAGGGPRQWLLPGSLALVLVAIVVTVLVLAQRAGVSGAPPKPAPFEPPREALEVVVYDVQSVTDGTIVFGASDVDSTEGVAIPAGARVERLSAMGFDEVRAGDWATVIGVVNGVRNYTIGSVVIMDGSPARSGDTELRSPGGFLGYEAARDPQHRVIIAGLIESVEDGRFLITTPGGPVSVWLEETEGAGPPPFLRLSESSSADVRTGDRVAFPATLEGKVDPAAAAVLVLDADAAGAPEAPAGAGGGSAPAP